MAAPVLLRTVAVSAMPDADWAATQVAPGASICADVSLASRIGVVVVALDAAGAVVDPSGTVDLALVDVAQTIPKGGVPSKALMKSTPVDAGITTGDGLEYDVTGCTLVTIRVDAEALAGTVDRVEIFWNIIE